MRTEIYNKRGKLTAYGFGCGYVERKENATHWKKMYAEHGVYHVLNGPQSMQYNNWESFDNLTEARKYYNSIKLN